MRAMSAPALSADAAPHPGRARPNAIANWLFAVAALVFLMVVVGGITRLTESGLSIVRWEPVTGAVPPLSEAGWQAEFELYKASPQYQQVNRGMSLAEFKNIYFWEYVHRLLGRIIGVAFAVPLVWFAAKRAIPKGYGWKLGGLLALGGLQGFIGWWMVASGLIDEPAVSHIRLAVHLLTAFAILGALLWVAMDLKALARDPAAAPVRMPTSGIWAISVLFVQMLFGAYVAGLDAGYAFNTWPKMGEEWFPAATPMMEPFLRNFVDNPIVVQFVHRWLAVGVAVAAGALAWQAGRRGLATAAQAVAWGVAIQFLLGILTILSGVELWIGVAHQGMAALLLAAIVYASHRLGERKA